MVPNCDHRFEHPRSRDVAVRDAAIAVFYERIASGGGGLPSAEFWRRTVTDSRLRCIGSPRFRRREVGPEDVIRKGLRKRIRAQRLLLAR